MLEKNNIVKHCHNIIMAKSNDNDHEPVTENNQSINSINKEFCKSNSLFLTVNIQKIFTN